MKTNGIDVELFVFDYNQTYVSGNLDIDPNIIVKYVKFEQSVFDELYSGSGLDMRQKLEDIALKNHYSILYYKTDTCLHDNPQKRPRTFVIFQRWQKMINRNHQISLNGKI